MLDLRIWGRGRFVFVFEERGAKELPVLEPEMTMQYYGNSIRNLVTNLPSARQRWAAQAELDLCK